MIERGQVIAGGTSDELKGKVGGERVEVTVADAGRLDDACPAVAPYGDGEPARDPVTRRLTIPVRRGAALLPDVVRSLDAAGSAVVDLAILRPTLDDVFLALTGRGTADEPLLEGSR